MKIHNYEIQRKHAIIAILLLITLASISAYYLTQPQTYAYKTTQSTDNITEYNWTATTSIQKNTSDVNQTVTQNATIHGHINYNTQTLTATKTLNNKQLTYTTNITEQTQSQTQQSQNQTIHLNKTEINHWNISHIPSERVTKTTTNNNTKTFHFNFTRLSISDTFITNITQTPDIPPTYLTQLSQPDWRTNGTATATITKYNQTYYLTALKYKLHGTPLNTNETITLHYNATYTYPNINSTNQTTQ